MDMRRRRGFRGGNVYAVSAPFEPSVKDIVFTKKPDARLSDPAYLQRFLGQYELTPQVITVGLRGSGLTLFMPGQPIYDLEPGLGDEFILKQAKVITLHFVQDGQGNVTALDVRQPEGVFTAKRK